MPDTKRIRPAFILAFCLIGALSALAQKTTAREETAWGLHTVTFQTPQGAIELNLPDDVAAGDTIAFTVLEQPAGKDVAEQRKHQDELDLYVVEVQSQPGPAKQQWRELQIPAMAAGAALGTLAVALRDKDGAEVGHSSVPVLNRAPAVPPQIAIPAVSQTGRPNSVPGPFEAAADYTATVGGQPAPVLAVSPRRLIFQAPVDVVGAADVELKRGSATVASGKTNFIKLTLSAPKTTLTRGEQTTLTAVVTGLEGIPESEFPIPLEMKCTPGVRFENSSGTLLVREIAYGDVQRTANAPASATVSTSLLATEPGHFTVHAAVQTGALGGANWDAAKSLLETDEDFGKWIDDVEKDLDASASKLKDTGREGEHKKYLKDLKERLEACKNMRGTELEKKKLCADLVLKGLRVVQAGAGLWNTGFDLLDKLFKALTLQKPPWDALNAGLDFMKEIVAAAPASDEDPKKAKVLQKQKQDTLERIKKAKEVKELAEKGTEIKENLEKLEKLLEQVKDYFKGHVGK